MRKTSDIPLWLWLALSVLLLLALAVIFVLPRIVSEYQLPFTPRVAVEVPAASTPAPLNAVSPFDEAQRARQRTEAQDVLASLLTLQQTLDESGVSVWAPERYEEAVSLARSGDEHYRAQAFAEATNAYRQSEQIFHELNESIPQVLADALTLGEQALQLGDQAQAEMQFRVALEIDMTNAEAQAGLGRAAALQEVNRLLDEGRQLRADGQLQEALTRFESAVALDQQHAAARAAVDETRVAVRDAEFGSLMSQGFASLQQGDPDTAIARFEAALRMRPASEQAKAALTQTRDELANSQISRELQQARQHEQAEQWEQTVAAYDRALAIDSNVVSAREGRDYAAKRLQLDRLLEEALAQPERLAESAVYEQAAGVYYAGRDLEAGPRLQQQLDRLEQLLSEAKMPVDVQLVSDNATQVTVYQVGALGQFQQQTLSLLPGRYVAVGVRPGYRDVRKEFNVGFGHQTEAVTIRCDEPVASEGR